MIFTTSCLARRSWLLSSLLGLAATAKAAAPFGDRLLLDDLLPANGNGGDIGFVISGLAPGDDLGRWLNTVGDLNADGVADMVVSAHIEPADGGSRQRVAYVVYGSTTQDSGAFDLADLDPANGADGSKGFLLMGSGDFATINAAAAAGDVNDDGIDDLLVGIPSAMPAGAVAVVFGRSGGLGVEIDISSLTASNGGDGSDGFVAYGHIPNGGLGSDISTAGDVNDDGIDDILIGAPNAALLGTPRGVVYIVFGTGQVSSAEFALEDLLPVNGGDGTLGSVLRGPDFSGLGQPVRAIGDINADGVDDIAVVARNASPDAYVVYGSATPFPAVLDMAALRPEEGGDGSLGFLMIGDDFFGGTSLAATNDINGDGFDDLLFGVGGAGNLWGRTYALFGSPLAFSATVIMNDLEPGGVCAGCTGFLLEGTQVDQFSSTSLAGGDVNGDGISDALVAGGLNGQSFIFFGSDDTIAAQRPLSSLLSENGGDGSAGFVLDGPVQILGEEGPHALATGDLNGDGVDDLLVGAYWATDTMGETTGRVYIVFGRSSNTDLDQDGIVDTVDNCQRLANIDQRDTDGDGFGNACDADLNNDCIVNVSDLGLLRSAFFTTDSDADFDGDGVVNTIDLGIMRSGFFALPGPSAMSICSN